jgi:hypothetical protein
MRAECLGLRLVRLPSKTLRECGHPRAAAQCQDQTHAPQQTAADSISLDHLITASLLAGAPTLFWQLVRKNFELVYLWRLGEEVAGLGLFH